MRFDSSPIRVSAPRIGLGKPCCRPHLPVGNCIDKVARSNESGGTPYTSNQKKGIIKVRGKGR